MTTFSHFRYLFFPILITAFLCGAVNALPAAEGDQGSATATFLKIDPYASSSGMGSARIADGGIEANHFNPAGLSLVDSTNVSVTQNQMFADITYRNLSMAAPVEEFGGSLGLSLTRVDYGSQLRAQVRNNNPVTGFGNFGADDLALSGSYGLKIIPSLSLGVSVEYLQSRIAGFNGSTLTGDVGLQYQTPISNLWVGLSARNLFGEITLNERGDPLPKVHELGVNYDWNLVPGQQEFKFGLGTGTSSDADRYVFAGVEYGLYETGFLRVGYRGSQEAGKGYTAGAGLEYAGLGVDYAYVPYGELGNQQRVTFTYRFGNPQPVDSNQRSGNEEPGPERSVQEGRSDPENVAELGPSIEAIRRLYRDGKLKRARRKLRSLQERNPDEPVVLLWRGKVENELGNRELASVLMDRVLRLDPDNTYAKKNLEKLHRGMKSERDEPQSPRARAQEHFAREKFDKARRILIDQHEKNPGDVEVLFLLAQVEYRMGLVESARKRTMDILELDPDNNGAELLYLLLS